LLKFKNPTAEIFVPDGAPLPDALRRVTHLGIGAHQDDLEFMAFHGIACCHTDESQWFGGVTCTNGGGSSRAGAYANVTDDEMRVIRRGEQNAAARIGRYGVMIQLDYPSAAVKSPNDTALLGDLIGVLDATNPRVVYTHNLADKHESHIGVAVAAIEAMRALPQERRPEAVYGCEVWRGLDWMPDDEKIIHDVSGHESLADALCTVFDSQIAGGKRYDLGVAGRRRANATFLESHAEDRTGGAAFAMNLTPLIRDESLDVAAFVDNCIGRFRGDVRAKLRRRLG
jgi:LmbE family N-acetylglucosaminyl deacetylase